MRYKHLVALRHPALVEALVLLSPVFAGGELGLMAEQTAAMAAMDAAGRRAVAEGIEALFPLFDRLPAEVRARARAIVATYDPASVAATTRFLASGVQPFGSASELAPIIAPTLIVPGGDPEHPVWIAELYRRHLLRSTENTVTPEGYATAITAFLD